MNGQQLGIVIVRGFVIYLSIHVLDSMCMFWIYDSDSARFKFLLTQVVRLILFCGFWFYAPKIAKSMVSPSKEAKSENAPITFENLQTIAITTAGFLILAQAIDPLAQSFLAIKQKSPSDLVYLLSSRDVLVPAFSSLTHFLFGFMLILGPKYFRRLIQKLRRQ